MAHSTYVGQTQDTPLCIMIHHALSAYKALSSSLCDPYAATGSKDYIYPHREVRAQVQGVEGQLDKGRSVAQWIITGLWIPTNL